MYTFSAFSTKYLLQLSVILHLHYAFTEERNKFYVKFKLYNAKLNATEGTI